MAYATYADVEAGFRTLTTDEQALATQLLDEAQLIIDAYIPSGTEISADVLKLVSCRMVRRAIGSEDSSQSFPIGATQGTVSALGYSQSWTLSSGSTGELYLSKLEKKLLRSGNSIGSHSPLEDLT